MHSGQFHVLLDACVLYPAILRDLLLSLAAEDLFRPKWSDEIQQEWVRNLLANRADIPEDALLHTVMVMNKAFPDANVSNYEEFISGITLPDPDDRHVVAAAVIGSADVIVTFNLKDFPAEVLSKYDIEVVHPDQFLINVIDLDSKKALIAFRKMLKRLKSPPISNKELLEKIKSSYLPKVAERISQIL